MCVLNGLDMLSSQFNKGTLALEPELQEHFLYQGIWQAIQNYNLTYRRMKKREAQGLPMDEIDRSDIKLNEQGDYVLAGDSDLGIGHMILDKDSRDVILTLTNDLENEMWPPMQAAKDDVIYEFQVLMGTIVLSMLLRLA